MLQTIRHWISRRDLRLLCPLRKVSGGGSENVKINIKTGVVANPRKVLFAALKPAFQGRFTDLSRRIACPIRLPPLVLRSAATLDANII